MIETFRQKRNVAEEQNASVLLNSRLMRELVHHAVQQYDYVIIVTTPICGERCRGVRPDGQWHGQGLCQERDLQEGAVRGCERTA